MLQINLYKDTDVEVITEYCSGYETDWFFRSNGYDTIANYLPLFNIEFDIFFNDKDYLESYLLLDVLGKTLEINVIS